uniref:Beta-hexosaminidase n=1 Tax=Lasioderma serricorne TaxID=295660 RepID=A0A3G1VUC7_9COLE|nr:beta-N-acetylglucosaminidase [Lasioderma serricorne]
MEIRRACLLLIAFVFSYSSSADSEPVWRWECISGTCQKTRITNETRDSALSLPACQLFCGEYGRLWPQPTKEYYTGNYLLHLNLNSIDLNYPQDKKSTALANLAFRRFAQQLRGLVPSGKSTRGGRSLVVNAQVEDPDIIRLTYATDESYILKINELSDGRVNASITSNTFFGARHALETLSQLIIYDDIRNELQIVRDASISDSPVYPHRGLLLDTARNFIPIDAIKRSIDGMAASKMNIFHWHITDSHSFPFVSKSRPELTRLGAYSSSQVYTEDDVRDLIEYARVRGVKVLPEFDAPAHVGEGWQDTGYVACLNAQPWMDYCVEPPCGQFDPTKDGLYDVLEDIYGDMVDLFEPDVFHMGGDEVSNSCWNSTESIVSWMSTEKSWGRTATDFVKLWDYFQSKALERLYRKTSSNIPIIMWTSGLTESENVTAYLPNTTYIIQVWTTAFDLQIIELLQRGYRLILSNYDALYLDCGFGGWVQGGNNWCSPYKGWDVVYSNSPALIAGTYKEQVLGSEGALWTEQVDGASVDGRIWPRLAALAERLWAEPSTGWKAAEERMLIHRERLIGMGIAAEALQPQWCLQNEGDCPAPGRALESAAVKRV